MKFEYPSGQRWRWQKLHVGQRPAAFPLHVIAVNFQVTAGKSGLNLKVTILYTTESSLVGLV